MAKRYKTALKIVDAGTSTPPGICYAIIDACREIRNTCHTGTDEICRDPAVRLMVGQLSYLVYNPGMSHDDYARCRKVCQVMLDREVK